MYPLLPNTPRVSDVLAWLSTHTNVVGKDEKTEALLPIIQLENFSYVMVKRPDQTKKQEKYQVKVEIEFTSPTPKQAREFHDALIAPNPLVDPKGEVKWTANKGKYRASFFLKDKTVYPTGK
jgi:type IV pilus assembly protein PilM